MHDLYDGVHVPAVLAKMLVMCAKFAGNEFTSNAREVRIGTVASNTGLEQCVHTFQHHQLAVCITMAQDQFFKGADILKHPTMPP